MTLCDGLRNRSRSMARGHGVFNLLSYGLRAMRQAQINRTAQEAWEKVWAGYPCQPRMSMPPVLGRDFTATCNTPMRIYGLQPLGRLSWGYVRGA